LAAAFHAIFDAIGAILMVTIVIYVWPIMVEAYQNKYYSGTAGVIEIPIWPFHGIVLVGAGVTAIQFTVDAWQDLVRASRHEPA
jgi:TRAP-type mannitol/chloroaromatic compound transport system permease small subunit